MINPDSQISYTEFIVFLLVYASYGDYQFSESELNRLKTKFDPFLVEKIHLKYDSMTDYERLSYLMKYKSPFLSSETDVNKIHEELQQQFDSDGIYCNFEKELNNFLKHILADEWN